MKKFLVYAAIFAAIFPMISCGGSEGGNHSGNNNQICNYGQYMCEGLNSYFCGYSSGELMWILAETCSNGCNYATGQCSNGSNNNGGNGENNGGNNGGNNDGGNNGGGNSGGNGNSEPEYVCDDGDFTCSGNNRLKCMDNSWHSYQACANGCSNGMCNSCTPQCNGRECGLDGCGGTCGKCDAGYDCSPAGSCLRNNLCSTHSDCTGDGMICYQGSCQTPWGKKWKLTFTEAKVMEKNKEGEAWDAFGGLPDLVAIARVNGNEVFRTNTVSDSTTAEWNKSTTIDFEASTDVIKYHLFDEDAFGGGSSSDDDTWLDSTNDEIIIFVHDFEIFTLFDQDVKDYCVWDNGVTVEYFCITLEPAW